MIIELSTVLGSILVFGVLYAIKGGSGASVFKNWNEQRDKKKVLDIVLDGKILSTILAFAFTAAVTKDLSLSLAIAAAWLASCAPSMGEEHGAVGDYKGPWGPYMLYTKPDGKLQFGQSYGVKKAVQRGILFGAAFTLATGYLPFILASLLFVPAIYVGQCLNRLVLKVPGWTLAEPLIGGLVVGLPIGLFLAERM